MEHRHHLSFCATHLQPCFPAKRSIEYTSNFATESLHHGINNGSVGADTICGVKEEGWAVGTFEGESGMLQVLIHTSFAVSKLLHRHFVLDWNHVQSFNTLTPFGPWNSNIPSLSWYAGVVVSLRFCRYSIVVWSFLESWRDDAGNEVTLLSSANEDAIKDDNAIKNR